MLLNSASFAILFTSPETKKTMVDSMQAYQDKYVEMRQWAATCLP